MLGTIITSRDASASEKHEIDSVKCVTLNWFRSVIAVVTAHFLELMGAFAYMTTLIAWMFYALNMHYATLSVRAIWRRREILAILLYTSSAIGHN